MNITLDNYEACFLDYIEGRLNSEELSELSLFLTLHPELKSHLHISEYTILQPNKYIYRNKSSLKKLEFNINQIDVQNFEEFCVAYHENLLSVEKSRELEDYCKLEPTRQQVLNDYKKVFLKPERNNVFGNKKSLYKHLSKSKAGRTIILRSLTLAAGVALIIGFYFSFKSENKNSSVNNITGLIKDNNKVNTEVTNKVTEDNIIVKNKLSIKKISKQLIVQIPNNQIADSSRNNIFVPRLVPELKLLSTSFPNTLKEIKNENSSAVEPETSKLVALDNQLEEIKNKNGYDKNKLSLFKIAKMGISGFNKLTNSNISLTEKTDSLGNITALSFQSELFEYHKLKAN